MKRLALFFALCVALTSCYNGIDITRKLSDEDAAIVPYASGTTVKFLNTLTNDTIEMTVTDDMTTVMTPCEEDEFTRFKIIYDDTYSYCRYITLSDICNLHNMHFVVRPDKKFDFRFRTYGDSVNTSVRASFDLNTMNPAPTATIEGVEYSNVYFHNFSTGGTVAFSPEKGILLIRTADNCAFSLIP